jgi:hypothetical protein
MAFTKATGDYIDQATLTEISAGIDWQTTPKTSAFTAVSGEGYLVDTTSAAITITLPTSPTIGDEIAILDYTGTANTNNIDITSSDNINGSSNDVKINYTRGGVSIIYTGSTQGWVSFSAVHEGTSSLYIPPISIDYLVVAGGGGGGRYGGGGGAGGLLSGTQNFSIGTQYNIVVGAGGAGHVGDAQYGGSGASGSNSSVQTIVASGGGGGGNYSNPGTTASNGVDGGSGGGAGRSSTNGPWSGGSGISGQGNDGGSSTSSYSNHNGGGGGGAGSAGGSGINGGSNGAGGNGLASSITGTSITYAGGGGGSHQNSGTVAGGSGGGGTGYGPTATATTDADGDNNTGGGGGGTSDNSINGTVRAGNGGSGVVILRVPTSSYSGTTTGSPTVTTDGLYTVIKYTSTGTYTA